MSTSKPIPDPIHPACQDGSVRPQEPMAQAKASAGEARDGSLLVPPIAGQRADIAFLGALRHQAHRLGGVIHHSREAELRIFLSNKLGRTVFDISPKRPRILLPPNATRYEAMTQMARLRHWHAVGRDEYRTMPSLARAQGDYDHLVMDPSWPGFTGAERAHAASAILALGGRAERPDAPERSAAPPGGAAPAAPAAPGAQP